MMQYFGQTEKYHKTRGLEESQPSNFMESLSDSPKFTQQVN